MYVYISRRQQELETRRIEMEESLKSDQSGDMSRFGKDIVNLHRQVEHARQRFKHFPVGPIGKFIKVNSQDPKVLKVIEAHLGRSLLNGYIVFCNEDRKLLTDLIKSHCSRFKPRIYNGKPTCAKHPVGQNKVQRGETYVSLLDLLNLENVPVHNLVVDVAGIESCLLFENQKEVQKLFSQPRTVPKNARLAITPDFFKFYPSTNNQSYSSYFIPEVRDRVSILVSDRSAEQQRLQNDLKAIKNELQALKSGDLNLNKVELASLSKQEEEIITKRGDVNRELTKMSRERSKICEEVDLLSDEVEASQRLEEAFTKAVQERDVASKAFEMKKKEKANLEIELKERIKEQKKWNLEAENLNAKISTSRQQRKQELVNKLQSEKEKLEKDQKKVEVALTNEKRKERYNMDKKKDEEMYLKCHKKGPLPKEIAKLGSDACKYRIKRLCESDGNPKLLELEKQLEMTTKALDEEGERVNLLKTECQNLLTVLEERDGRRKGVSFETYRGIKVQVRTALGNHGLVADEFIFDPKDSILRLKVNGREVEQLSGGERSKTLSCLIMGLWKYVFSPIRCMDEWDVGLDDDARPEIEEMLVEWGKNSKDQTLFISPTKSGTGLAKWNDDPLVKVITLDKSQ